MSSLNVQTNLDDLRRFKNIVIFDREQKVEMKLKNQMFLSPLFRDRLIAKDEKQRVSCRFIHFAHKVAADIGMPKTVVRSCNSKRQLI